MSLKSSSSDFHRRANGGPCATQDPTNVPRAAVDIVFTRVNREVDQNMNRAREDDNPNRRGLFYAHVQRSTFTFNFHVRVGIHTRFLRFNPISVSSPPTIA